MDSGKKMRSVLWDSLEMAHIRSSVLLYTLGVLAGAGIVMLKAGHTEASAAGFGLALLCVLPFWGFYAFRIFRIYRKPGEYILCKGKLSQVHSGSLRYTMYFTVVLKGPQGEVFVVDTHAIFMTHGLQGPLVEDYVNQTVTVAYNTATEEVVVIG